MNEERSSKTGTHLQRALWMFCCENFLCQKTKDKFYPYRVDLVKIWLIAAFEIKNKLPLCIISIC